MTKYITSISLLCIILLLALLLNSCGGGGSSSSGSSSGSFSAVYLADKETDGTDEIYSYNAETGNTIKLNAPLTPGGDVTSFAISPDNTYVAYVADQITDNKFDLYVTLLDGSGTPVLISDVPNEDDNDDVADNPIWAPNSSRIAYRSDEATNDAYFNLRTVRPDGSDNVVINPAGIGNGHVQDGSVSWAPNSSRVAYLADVNGAFFDLYTSLPTSSSGAINISQLQVDKEVTDYSWAPNSSYLLFRSDRQVDDRYELFTKAPSGGPIYLVSGNLSGAQNLDVIAETGVWAPNSSRIAFLADGEIDGIHNLYTNTPLGDGLVQLNVNPNTGADVVSIPAWSPNSNWIAYVGNLGFDSTVFELYTSRPTVPLTSTRVNADLLGGNVEVGPIPPTVFPTTPSSPPAWSPSSALIAYIAEQDNAGLPQVYSGNPAGGPNTVMLSPVANGIVELGPAEEVWSPNGSRVLYAADISTAGTRDLYVATTDAGSNKKITGSPAANDGLKDGWEWTQDNSSVVYLSEQNTSGVIELFSTLANGTSNSAISGTLVSGGDVVSYELSY